MFEAVTFLDQEVGDFMFFSYFLMILSRIADHFYDIMFLSLSHSSQDGLLSVWFWFDTVSIFSLVSEFCIQTDLDGVDFTISEYFPYVDCTNSHFILDYAGELI